VTASQTADGIVIRVKGEARTEFAGVLRDGLLTAVARRPAVVTLDLSELQFISRLALGVLVWFRHGVVRSGGRVLLADEIQPAVREILERAGLLALFSADATPPSPRST
jgi:anti-anti-sigma factor